MIMEKLLSENIYSDYMDSVRESIIERCDEVDVLLHKYFDDLASWTKPTYGVTYRLNFNKSVIECINTLRKEGLLLFPPSFFGSGKNFIWFCYTGVSVEKLEHALSRISFHMRRTGKH
jgi:GntR family transcriptional regulator of abcA and norABC